MKDAPAESRDLSRAARVRRLAYVARALSSKHYGAGGNVVYAVTDARAFRRAFVEASIVPMASTSHEGDRTVLRIGDRWSATLRENGVLEWPNYKDDLDKISPFGLGPTNVANAVLRAHRCWEVRLCKRYAELSGFESAASEARFLPLSYSETDAAVPAPGRITSREHLGGYFRTHHGRSRADVVNAMKEFCRSAPASALQSIRLVNALGAVHRPLVLKVFGRDAAWWEQALKAYPMAVMVAIAFSPRDKVKLLFNAISQGRQMLPQLADCLGLTIAELRRLRGVTPQRSGRIEGLAQLRFLVQFPQHLHPRSRQDYKQARKLFDQYQVMVWRAGDGMHSVAANAQTLTAGLKVALGSEPRIDRLVGMRDVVECAQRALSSERYAQFMKTLFGMNLPRLVHLNERWHRVHREISGRAARVAMEQSREEHGWPGVIPGRAMDLGDMTAVELLTSDELLDEGVRMQHCVGGYYVSCFSGLSRIVSLRDTDGRSRSTVQLALRRKTRRARPTLYVAQHCGPGNQDPSAEDRAAAKLLLARLGPSARRPWPCLNVPETIELRMDRMVYEEMAAFFSPMCATDMGLAQAA
ncbi:PcfJ domain-containing protein [Xanthomonas euvesicatoria]